MANLKLINGKDEIVYKNVETIVCPTESGSTQTYETFKTKQELTVTPDLSSGGQTVLPDTGSVLTKVTIEKPSTLKPENIASGVTIFGVVGTLESGGGSGGGSGGVEVLAKQDIVVEYAEEDSGCFAINNGALNLKSGNTYLINFDEVSYECVPITIEGVTFMGNMTAIELEDSGEPFVIMEHPEEGVWLLATFDTETTTHSVQISLINTLDDKVLFPRQPLFFSSNSEFGNLHTNVTMGAFTLEAGNTYTVYWDDVRYEVTGVAMTMPAGSGVGIGNAALAGLGENTGEPFIIGYAPATDANVFISSDTKSIHNVGVY